MINRDRFELARSMDCIVKSMNNECAYYENWIYIMPDEATEDDYEWVADDENKESFKELADLFGKLCRVYMKDGLVAEGVGLCGEAKWTLSRGALKKVIWRMLNWASEVSPQTLEDLIKSMRLDEDELKELNVDDFRKEV